MKIVNSIAERDKVSGVIQWELTDSGEWAGYETPEELPARLTENNGAWNAYRARANDELEKSDMVAFRCFKAGVGFPPEWREYVDALRVIVAAPVGDATAPFPVKPVYPVGT